MDFYNIFKSFLGIPNSISREGKDLGFEEHSTKEEETPWHSFNPDFDKFVQEQMQHLMSAFGMSRNETFFDDITSSSPTTSLRDQYLKPGFESASSNKADTDLDGSINIDELDLVLKSPSHSPLVPYAKTNAHRQFFGQTASTRTMVRPDGSIETVKTVTDSKGNKETIVIRRDKHAEHTITTRVTASGDETKEENVVHFNEGSELPFDPFLK